MKIYITKAIGVGSTLLSAFDNALVHAGIHNYNLIPLSSVIPPHTIIQESEKYLAPKDEFGNRLYVVRAEIRSNRKGESIAAGIGWYQLEDNQGFFVEHEGIFTSKSEGEKAIVKQIHDSLHDLCNSRNLPFNENLIHSSIISSTVEDKPTCVLVAAVYKSEGWE